MSSYFQMGHDTENLVGETNLEDFSGIVLSPLNRTPEEFKSHIPRFREKGNFDIILDPQLYFPKSLRGNLKEHPYFPSDLDTADISSISWWKKIIKLLVEYSTRISIDAVATPVIYPKIWTDEYYSICGQIAEQLNNELIKHNIKTYTTVLVNLHQLSEKDEALRIASIISNTSSTGFYIIFSSDIDPRREFSDSSELLGAMVLIRSLRDTGLTTMVSNCSSDMILYKAAGAAHCSTGKFFNLRRFTKSRWDEPSSGGGVLPYWFEHSLLAFLRESDLLRLIENEYKDMVAQEYSDNIWSRTILKKFIDEPEKPWVGMGWRQYLSWFCKAETDLSDNNSIENVKTWLENSENNWLKLEDDELLFEEPRNTGSWIRQWRLAAIQFSKLYS